MYIRNGSIEDDVKITRRSDKCKGGHLLISVPAGRVAEGGAALSFLEAKRQQRGSRIVTDLIVRTARHSGWQQDSRADHSTDP
jgi:hypothetical protein